jgi:sortase A
MMNGASIGAPGNLILAGHRTSWFRPLESVALGDRVWIEWRDRASGWRMRREYQVSLIRVVEPDDPSLLAPTDADVVTLVTCYPFGPSPHSPQRYVVRAGAVGEAAYPGESAGRN